MGRIKQNDRIKKVIVLDSRKSGDILGIEKSDRIIASTGTRVLKGGKDIHPEEIVALRTSLGLFSRYY